MKRAITLILALMLCVSLALPALASTETYPNAYGEGTISFSDVISKEKRAFFQNEEYDFLTVPASGTVMTPSEATSGFDFTIGLYVGNRMASLNGPGPYFPLAEDGTFQLSPDKFIEEVLDHMTSWFAFDDLTEVPEETVKELMQARAFVVVPSNCKNVAIVFASGSTSAEMTAPAPAVGVTVNGKAVEWTDAAPFIDENNRTLVPLRAVADALGIDVNWDAANREAVFTNGTKTIYFPIGGKTARTGDGGTVEMDTAAVLANNRTYAPARALADFFGYTVDWDAATRTVVIK